MQLHLNIIQPNAQAQLVSLGSGETESDKHERVICKFLMIVAIKNLKAIITMPTLSPFLILINSINNSYFVTDVTFFPLPLSLFSGIAFTDLPVSA